MENKSAHCSCTSHREVDKGENQNSVTTPDFPEPSLWNSPIGRRSFLKKTGAATAATALAIQASKMEVLANASGHCVIHNNHCDYVVSISVVFTSKSDPVQAPPANHTQSGKVYHGTMTITKYCCLYGGQTTTDTYAVHTGGYRSDDNNRPGGIPQGGDTGAPEGSFEVGSEQTSGIPGYNFPVPNRANMEVHRPGRSAGCIVFDQAPGWEVFQELMNEGNNKHTGCPHNPPHPVPMIVDYDFD